MVSKSVSGGRFCVTQFTIYMEGIKMSISIVGPRRSLVLADLVSGSLVGDILLVCVGAGLVGVCAQVSIPLPGTPVPLTLQTLGVLLVGSSLGARRALWSMLLYLLAGAIGVPWFAAHTSGVRGASFGYVIGFVLAAFVVGVLASRGGDRTIVRTVFTMGLGTVLIYAIGLPWLMASAGLNLWTALAEGLAPFVVGDVIKVLGASVLMPMIWGLVGRGRR